MILTKQKETGDLPKKVRECLDLLDKVYELDKKRKRLTGISRGLPPKKKQAMEFKISQVTLKLYNARQEYSKAYGKLKTKDQIVFHEALRGEKVVMQ